MVVKTMKKRNFSKKNLINFNTPACSSYEIIYYCCGVVEVEGKVFILFSAVSDELVVA